VFTNYKASSVKAKADNTIEGWDKSQPIKIYIRFFNLMIFKNISYHLRAMRGKQASRT